ncbi:MAG: hypothetical protein JWN30_322 [Bacilli bacterium]|nr:hypothetical protein [Bacilli bacterium]
MNGNIQKEIQFAVDHYINVYKEYKKIKDQLDDLHGIIEPYMKENDLTSIHSSDGRGKVELLMQERPIMNARYTTYDVEQVANLLTASSKKKCIVEVVDKDKLEALCKLGEVSADVLQHKLTRAGTSFVTRLIK